MDPIVKEPGKPNDLPFSTRSWSICCKNLKRIHYLHRLGQLDPASFGAGGPRNAEASLRFEFDFADGDLDGKGTSLASEVN